MTLTVFSELSIFRSIAAMALLTMAQSGLARTLEHVELVVDGKTIVLRDVEVTESEGTMRIASGPAVIRSGHCQIEMAGMSRLSVKSIEAQSVSIILDGHARFDAGALMADTLDVGATGATSFRAGDSLRRRHSDSRAVARDHCK